VDLPVLAALDGALAGLAVGAAALPIGAAVWPDPLLPERSAGPLGR